MQTPTEPKCHHCEHHNALPQKAPAHQAGSANHGTLYTCPMHPEIQRSQPDICPIWSQNKTCNNLISQSNFHEAALDKHAKVLEKWVGI